MTISDISTTQLIKDYNELETTEDQYFTLLKKYFPDSTYEPDEIFHQIKLELAERQISGIDVKTVEISQNLYEQEEKEWGNTMCPCCAVLLKTHNQRGLMQCLHYAVSKEINLKGNNTTADIVQRLKEKISMYESFPHECTGTCGCKLTKRGESELKLLKSILNGAES